jgi:hypothetical protein
MIDKTRIYHAINKVNITHELMFGVYLDYSTGDYSHCEELICVVNTLNEAEQIIPIIKKLDIRGWYNSKSTISYRADIDNFTWHEKKSEKEQ